MNLVVISPAGDEPREYAVLRELFAAGLARYHVRKPGWSHARLAQWLGELPPPWRARLVLHGQHELVSRLELGGRHWPDDGAAPLIPPGDKISSRSCHDLASVRAALGRYDAVLFGPVFSSISKPGHGPRHDLALPELSALLAARSSDERRTGVFALGGITADTLPQATALGFDGVAALGFIWEAADPVEAFLELQNAAACHAA